MSGITMTEAMKFARMAHYRNIQKMLDDLILGTPTGKIRERLTEANILLGVCHTDQMRADQGLPNDGSEPDQRYTNQD